MQRLYDYVDFTRWPTVPQEQTCEFILERVDSVPQIQRLLANLARQGLLLFGGRVFDNPLAEQGLAGTNVGITWLGKDFVEKCRSPLP